MGSDNRREMIIGSESGPQPPYPLRMKGKVVSGFGRGSKELGIPTANIPVDEVPWIETIESGVYFGWASIQLPTDHPSHPSSSTSTAAQPANTLQILQSALPESAVAAGWVQYPMVMSIGYNPFYKNTVRSAEVHVLYKFENDFYGSEMAISILGFIRKELDYVSVEKLIEDIEVDCEVARRSLNRDEWKKSLKDPYLWGEEI